MIRKEWLGSLTIGTLFLIVSCGGSSGSGSASPSIDTASAGSFENRTLAEVTRLDFTTGSASLSFSSAEAEDSYLVIVNAPAASSGNYPIQLTSISDNGLLSEPSALTAAPSSAASDANEGTPEDHEVFHEYLREMESQLAGSEQVPFENPLAAALTVAQEVGQGSSFRVLSSINSITAYQDVSATLRYKSSDLLIYVDGDNSDQIDDDDVQELAHNFEDIALPLERNLFGHESDVNADGHITILMTCVVNRMASSGGLVTGFFFPGDMYVRSDYNPASNAQEIFYTMMPDPEGSCGIPVSATFTVDNILPGVLAHEYQHMTSFNQHVFKKGGSTEEAWLNEGLSHFAEDITGFGNENPSRVKLFLAQPATTPLIPPTSPTLAERGGCYLFLRYLYEQSSDGDAFLSNLYASKTTGITNLENAFAGTNPDFDEFSEFVERWSVALALSETGVTDDPRYNFEARNQSEDTGNFTGVCIRCDAQDGRGTVLGGPVINQVKSYPSSASVSGTASQFYSLNDPSGTIRLSGNGSLTGNLVRLSPEN